MLIAMLIFPAMVQPQSQVSLAYDSENQSLKVTITHQVSNPSGHYVYEIAVTENGEQALVEDTRASQRHPHSAMTIPSTPVQEMLSRWWPIEASPAADRRR